MNLFPFSNKHFWGSPPLSTHSHFSSFKTTTFHSTPWFAPGRCMSSCCGAVAPQLQLRCGVHRVTLVVRVAVRSAAQGPKQRDETEHVGRTAAALGGLGLLVVCLVGWLLVVGLLTYKLSVRLLLHTLVRLIQGLIEALVCLVDMFWEGRLQCLWDAFCLPVENNCVNKTISTYLLCLPLWVHNLPVKKKISSTLLFMQANTWLRYGRSKLFEINRSWPA